MIPKTPESITDTTPPTPGPSAAASKLFARICDELDLVTDEILDREEQAAINCIDQAIAAAVRELESAASLLLRCQHQLEHGYSIDSKVHLARDIKDFLANRSQRAAG